MFDLSSGKGNRGRSRERSQRNRKTYTSQNAGYQSAGSRSGNRFESDDDDDWLVTFSDAMTLLLVFFVLLLSVSRIDQSKFEQVSGAIQGKVLKKEAKRPFHEAEQQLQKLIQRNDLEEQVKVELTSSGIKMALASTALYEPGSAAIKEGKLPVLEDLATIITAMDLKGFMIEVEGHTDDVPIRSDRYPTNWELSSHRATNVVKFLIRQGVSPQKLKAVGYADSRPIVPNLDASGEPLSDNRARNRRVVIQISRM